MRVKYVLSEVLTGLWRNVTMTIAMIITMAVSLTMLGAGVLLYLQVNDMRELFYARVEVSIFLNKDITDEQRQTLEAELRNDPLVSTVKHETREEAFENFRKQFQQAPQLVDSIKADDLPESFRVKLKDPQTFKEMA